ncbi:MAG: outer-membrane lipoprotein carrier protein LolA [Pseudomonadota bacterium]|nr:outer-membrane lipoprotein carrier protein LolA [Pseudomonadota bacterium]
MARSPAAFFGACILGLSAIPAAAQSVPLPVPAPQPKISAAAPDKPKPPSALPPTASAPASSAIPNLLRSLAGIGKPGETVAFDSNQRLLVDKVSGYLSGIRYLTGNFVQVAPDGSKTKGELYLQKPGRVRFAYNDPSPIELIADGQSLVVRDRKLATQDLYPLGQTPLRFLLADRVDLLKDTNVIGVYSDDVFTTVVIEEKSLGGVHRLMLMFAAQDLTLRQWTITDPQGYDTTVAVYNLDTSKRPDPTLFKINYDRVLQ